MTVPTSPTAYSGQNGSSGAGAAAGSTDTAAGSAGGKHDVEGVDPVVRPDWLIADVARIWWRELPILFAVNLLCVLGAVVVVGLFQVSWVLALVAVPAILGPIAAVAFGVADRLTDGRAIRLSGAARMLYARGLVGARVLLVPAVPAGVGYAVLAAPGVPVPLRVGVLCCAGMVLTVTVVALPAALSLGVTASVGGVRRWRVALAVVAGQPLLALGGLAFGVLCAVAVDVVGAGLLVALPGPWAVLCSALTWTGLERLR